MVDIIYDSLRGGCGAPWCGSVEMYKRGWEGFFKCVRYEVGDGSKMQFWHDV